MIKRLHVIEMVLLLGGVMVTNAVADLAVVQQKLAEADSNWTEGAVAKALPQYEAILDGLPESAKPFQATLIMRLAYARLAAGDKAGCLAALNGLDKMDYVPEHHALEAEELKAVAAGNPNLGYSRTPIPPVITAGKTFFVDAAAAALGDGSVEKPFATLNEAVMATRVLLRKSRKRPAVEIVLAPGIYRQQEPVRLSPADMGQLRSPLVIRSRDAKQPATLTGGTVLSKWTTLKDQVLLEKVAESLHGKVLVCDLTAHKISGMGPLVFGGFSSPRAQAANHRFNTMSAPELFYKGEPQIMARWPNGKLTRIPVNEKPKEEIERFRRWANEENLWLYGYWNKDWADGYEKVASVGEDGSIKLVPPTNYYGFNRRKGCAVNALCELDEPGEWYLDLNGNRVVYLPPKDFDPEQCVLSSFGTVIDADGCSNLQIRDLKINYIRGDAISFRDCSNLLLAGLDIQDCSGLGIRVHGGKKHLVHSCRIESMGRGAIDLWAGDWKNLIPADSIVENCHISNLSRIDRTYTPALLIEGMGLKVRYNSFVDIPSSAIRVEACDALIELNYFRRCVYESGDQGAIDMWANPLYRGNVIRWNDFDSIVNPHAHYGAAAVRCDDYISGFMIVQNIMRKGSSRGFGAVQFNQGTDSYVEGNIIVDWKKAFSGRSTGGGQWKASITSHPNSKRMLDETDWESEAWQKKYPMVRDLMNGDDNHNYLVGNLRLGSGDWGGVGRSVSFGNQVGDVNVHGDKLSNVKPHLLPWYPIPIDLIGPYQD